MKIGLWDVNIISGGHFALDGGAMFGTVPKVVWSKVYPCDADNQITMATNCLLIQGVVNGKKEIIVVDNGNGDKEDDTFMARFKFEGRGVLDAELLRFGVRPEDVTCCILTHLHFDHAGGSTRFDDTGALIPSFPNARYIVQKQDFDDARSPHLRVRASYLPKNWEPLVERNLLETLEGPAEIFPGISVRLAPGHIKGLQSVLVTGEGKTILFTADLIPTSRHIQPAWVMGYDLDVVTCVDEKIKVIEECVKQQTILVFEHDPDIKAGIVTKDLRGKYQVNPVSV